MGNSMDGAFIPSLPRKRKYSTRAVITEDTNKAKAREFSPTAASTMGSSGRVICMAMVSWCSPTAINTLWVGLKLLGDPSPSQDLIGSCWTG
jgi:hypothetical protein